MATFSINQVRQLYVANALKTPHVLSTDGAGSIAVSTDKDKTHLYFEYKGADNLTRSDLINIKDIISVTATDAAKLTNKLKSYTVTLDSTINSGKPVSGQDYILRIAFRQFVGLSDEDQYFKYGVVHAYAGMTTSDFYKVLAISLAKNFSREIEPLVKIELKTSSSAVLVDGTTKASSLTGTYIGVIITEVEQPWRLGVMAQTPVYFTVQPTTIIVEGDEVVWGTVIQNASTEIGNGKNIADLEYFCMGARGDMYRNIAWPHNIPTTYLVDHTLAYNVIDIHYAYVGNNEGVQKSEKTITLVVPKVGATNSVSNALANSIITSINTATGLNVAKLDTSGAA